MPVAVVAESKVPSTVMAESPEVSVVEKVPAGSIVTQAITMPYAVVAVSGAKFVEVVWKP